MFSKFILPILIIIAVALLQNTDFFTIYGIKPNLILSILIVLAFTTKRFWIYISEVLIGLILLQSFPGLEKEILVLFLLLLGIFGIRKLLPWQSIISIVILIAVATFVFYLLINKNFILNNYSTLIFEIIYNIGVGIIFYLLYAYKKTRV